MIHSTYDGHQYVSQKSEWRGAKNEWMKKAINFERLRILFEKISIHTNRKHLYMVTAWTQKLECAISTNRLKMTYHFEKENWLVFAVFLLLMRRLVDADTYTWNVKQQWYVFDARTNYVIVTIGTASIQPNKLCAFYYSQCPPCHWNTMLDRLDDWNTMSFSTYFGAI